MASAENAAAGPVPPSRPLGAPSQLFDRRREQRPFALERRIADECPDWAGMPDLTLIAADTENPDDGSDAARFLSDSMRR